MSDYSKYEKRQELLKNLYILADILILSLYFVLTSIPIITLGASISAMHKTFYEVYVNERSSYKMYSIYWKSFKSSLKQTSILWVGYLLIVFLFLLNEDLIHLNLRTTWMNYVSRNVLKLFIVLLSPYLYIGFAYIARFKDTLNNVVKNTGLLILMNLKTYILILIYLGITAMLIWLLPILVLILPGFVSYKLTRRIEKVFSEFINFEEEL